MDTQPPSPAATRRNGMKIFVAGLGIFALGMAHYELGPHSLLLLALPGAYALSGLLEIITGVPFMQFARRWDELKGWQRGVIGAAVALAAMTIIILGIGLCATKF